MEFSSHALHWSCSFKIEIMDILMNVISQLCNGSNKYPGNRIVEHLICLSDQRFLHYINHIV